MHRMPPRRQPRIAAYVSANRGSVLVVLDAWEVRAVVVGRSATRFRRLLLQERPVLVVSQRPPAWLCRMRVQVETRSVSLMPAKLLRLRTFPELRRFQGTRHEPALRRAVTLAHEALIHLFYDQPFCRN